MFREFLIVFLIGILLMIFLNLLDITIYMKPSNLPLSAIAFMPPYGYISLTENLQDKNVIIKTTLSGLPPNRKLGCHIHQFGDIRDCMTTGPHYNPHNKNHGGPNDIHKHVGDLGNLRVNANDTTSESFAGITSS